MWPKLRESAFEPSATLGIFEPSATLGIWTRETVHDLEL
jgi:hypothetical protein